MHAAWGRLPWARLVAPAAQLARSGFAAHPYLVYILSAGQARIMVRERVNNILGVEGMRG